MPGSSPYKFRISGRYVRGSTIPANANYNLKWNTSGYWEAGQDTTVPSMSLATVSGANMVLHFDEQLDPASVPAVTDFAVVIGGSADVVTVVAINGDVVRLTLTTAATYNQSATVAYTKPGSNVLQDLAGNDVATFGATTAINYTSTAADTTAPRHSIFLVNTATITIEYDEQLDTGFTPATTAYSVVVNGAAGVNPSAVSVNGSAVRLTITAVVSTDTVTAAYTQPGANQLRDLAGNLAASFTAQSCTNVTDRAVGGTPSSQEFGDPAAAGSSVTATALDHKHGFPARPGSYEAIISALPGAPIGTSYWDGFEGRAATVASSERYEAATSGGTTPTFGAEIAYGRSFLNLGSGVSLATEYTNFGFTDSFQPAKGEDWGFKAILYESVAPVIGAGTLYYLIGFLLTTTASTSDGIYLRSQDSGNWFLVCRSGGAETTTDLGIGPDTTWRLLEFRITGAGTSVQAYVDNVATGAAITTNIPTPLLRCYALIICNADITSNGILRLCGWGIQPGF